MLLLFSLSLAAAQTLPTAVQRSVNAQALAFTRHPCAGKYTARKPKEAPEGRFQYVSTLLDDTWRQIQKSGLRFSFARTTMAATCTAPNLLPRKNTPL